MSLCGSPHPPPHAGSRRVRFLHLQARGIVRLNTRGRVWAESDGGQRCHAAIRAHVSSRQTLNAVAREARQLAAVIR
jgi:hypothetical protein